MVTRLVTAVSLYGPKTREFGRLLENVQQICGEHLGQAFRPYALEQIHGTVIRLDGMAGPAGGPPVNQRWLDRTGTGRAMDLARALDILAAGLTPPVRIQVGGFAPGAAAAFTSRGQLPCERMFSAQGKALVLVGWPVSTVRHGLSQRPLDDLRHRMADAGVWHWYHDSPQDIDNDLHLVIGHHDGAPAADVTGAVGSVRRLLHRVLRGVEVPVAPHHRAENLRRQRAQQVLGPGRGHGALRGPVRRGSRPPAGHRPRSGR